MTAVRAAIGLGSNLGDSAAVLVEAAGAVEGLPHTTRVARSRLYATRAWGLEAQPDFLNAVVVVETALAPHALLDHLLGIERAAGRDRSAAATRWGPRVLDLDVLLHGAARIDGPGLQVPHPHLHQRAFALAPLLEAWPDAVIPGIGPADQALARIPAVAMRAVPYAPWDAARPD